MFIWSTVKKALGFEEYQFAVITQIDQGLVI